MKIAVFFILALFSVGVFAQQKINTVSVSHYPNAELYIRADVLCRITDKSGKPAESGGYMVIDNRGKSTMSFSYPANSKALKKVAPGQRLLIPIRRNSAITVVPLKVKYTPAGDTNIVQKLQHLRALHSKSDQLTYSKAAPGSIKPRIYRNSKSVTKVATKPSAKVLAKRTAAGKKAGSTEKIQEKVYKADSLSCISTSKPVYYTFYYLKVRNDVIYSRPFGVPSYTNEEEGNDLLDQAWFCFVESLRKHYSDKQVDVMLTDPDNDLQIGLLHLRDPFISSETIAETYPSTRSLQSAQSELESWLAEEKRKYPGLRYILIDL